MLNYVSCLGSVYIGSNPLELDRSLHSLFSNDYKYFEVVLVIDGSLTDRHNLVLSKYQSFPGFVLVPLPFNMGLGAALRIGLEHCSHDYVLRFDTDDLFTTDRISLTVAYFKQNPSVDIVTSPVCEFFTSDSRLVKSFKRSVPATSNAIEFGLSFRNCVNHTAVAFKKLSIENIGSYEPVDLFEDYFLWLKSRKARLVIGVMDHITVFMRLSTSFSSRTGLSYLLKELAFVSMCAKRGILPLPLFLLLPLRLFMRLITKLYHFVQIRAPWRVLPDCLPNPDFIESLTPDLMCLRR